MNILSARVDLEFDKPRALQFDPEDQFVLKHFCYVTKGSVFNFILFVSLKIVGGKTANKTTKTKTNDRN